MEIEHPLILSVWLNAFLHKGFALFGWHTEGDIVPPYILMAFLSALLIVLFFKLTVKNLSLFPGKIQNLLEMIYRFFQGIVDDFIGHDGRRFIPVLGTLGMFIVVSNLLGLFPEMGSPTANLNVTAGCALFIFFYYHSQGIRKHGFLGYLRTFCGPALWMAPIFAPIELISHFSRPLSLSIRLFCNIFGEDLVIIIIATLVPFIAPLPIMALAIITSVLQGMIFVILSAIYLSGAIAEEH